MTRECGGCTKCCKLVPVVEGRFINGRQVSGMNKPAGQRCLYQRRSKGCSIYDRRPMACRTWSCRWLVEDDTANLSRPDRSHCVIDIMPDIIVANGERLQIIQIWVDPSHPDAWRTPEMLAYIDRRGAENIATLIRYDSKKGIVVFSPSISSDKQWHEISDTDPSVTVVPQGSLNNLTADAGLDDKVIGSDGG